MEQSHPQTKCLHAPIQTLAYTYLTHNFIILTSTFYKFIYWNIKISLCSNSDCATISSR
jgi:hypothetical protein